MTEKNDKITLRVVKEINQDKLMEWLSKLFISLVKEEDFYLNEKSWVVYAQEVRDELKKLKEYMDKIDSTIAIEILRKYNGYQRNNKNWATIPLVEMFDKIIEK